MADTQYTDNAGPAVNAAWLNDVNNTVYHDLGGPGSLGNTANGKGADLVAGAAKKVASIAALRALRVPQESDAQTVIVDGYSAVGDGGGGAFIWSSTAANADDGGTIIAPNSGSGRWLRLFTGRVSVKWFGAKGDWNGTTGTNDTTAFAAALASGAKRVWVPAASYLLNSAQLTIPSGVQVEGDGASLTTLVSGYAGWLFYCKQGFKGIKGLTIQGNTTVQANAVAYGIDLHTDACHNWKLEDVWLNYLVSAIDARGSWTGRMEDVYVFDCGSSSAYAVYMGTDANNNQTNDIEYDNLQITGDANWNGQGLYTDGYGHVFSNLHLESIQHANAWTNKAQGVSANGGYLETRNGDASNTVTLQQGVTFNGTLINCKIDPTAAPEPSVFNNCGIIYGSPPIINAIYNGSYVAGNRALGIMGTSFTTPLRINKASMVKLKTVTQGTFEEYASGYNIPSDTAVGDYYGSSHTATVTTTSGQFLTGTRGMIFTKTADTANGGSIGFTFNPALANRKLCAWAIVQIPSGCPNIQVSFGLGGYDFSDGGQLQVASYSTTNGNWTLLMVKDFVPYSNYVTFNCNKVGGGSPPNGEYFLVDSFGVCEGGLTYDNLSNI